MSPNNLAETVVPVKPNRRSTPRPQSSVSEAAAERLRSDARVVEELLIPTQLHALLADGLPGVGVQGVRLYLLQITAAAKDPVEKMLLQQFVVAHHRLMQLHLAAEKASQLEAVKTFNAAAARLQGELRRLALAIRLYRAPVSPKTFTVVEQQNVATKQEVNFHSHGPDHKMLHCRNSEQESNPPEPSHDDTSRTASYEGPQPGANRLRESGALEGVHTGRP